MTVYCVNSDTTYSDISSAVAAEAGINYGVPTAFEQTGTSTGAVTFSGGSFASGINYYAVTGEETDGTTSVGAQCDGVITTSVNPLTVSNLRTQRINDLVTTSIYTNLVGNGQGSQDVFTNGTFDNCIAYNCSEGWRGGGNAVTTNCTVVDATGIGFLSSKCTGAATLNTSNSAYIAPVSGSANYWADDGTGSDAITEATKTDIFENYATGDYRIKPTSSVGAAGAGAFINSGGGGGATGIISQTLQGFSQSLSGSVVNSYAGSIAQVTQAFTQSSSGSITSANTTGTITQTANSFTQSATGSTVTNITGAISQNMSAFTQSLSATVVENITGTVTQAVNSFTQSLTATVAEQITGSINQTITGFTMSATGKIPASWTDKVSAVTSWSNQAKVTTTWSDR